MNNGSVGIERLSISVYSLFNRQMKRALITSKQTAIFFPGSLRRLRLWVRGRKGARFARTPTWKHTQLWMSRLFCDPDMQRSPVRCLLVIYFFTYFQAWNAFCMRIALGDHIRWGLAWSGHIEFLNRDPFVVRKIYLFFFFPLHQEIISSYLDYIVVFQGVGANIHTFQTPLRSGPKDVLTFDRWLHTAWNMMFVQKITGNECL